MSRELDELREIARREREKSWKHVRALPRRTSDVASAGARAHPFLTAAAAAAIAMSLVPKRKPSGAPPPALEGRAPTGSRAWSGVLVSLGLQMLPELLRLAEQRSSAPDDGAGPRATNGEPRTRAPLSP